MSESKSKTTEPSAAPAATPAVEPAPKGTTLEGLKDNDQIEVTHPQTGQSYGMSVKAFKDKYEAEGFVPVRQGNSQLLPGDKRAPDPATIPADNPPITVGEPQPAPAADGTVRDSDLSDTERERLKATEE